MEFGPRALGGRSIIGDARSPEMQSKMNLKIKFRESFRPFAPSILEEQAGDYFDFDHPSPYMLLVYDVADQLPAAVEPRRQGQERAGQAPGAGVRPCRPSPTSTSRPACIRSTGGINPYYHAVIEEFDKLTGCPLIINTSFNVRGEPIVESPEDAYRCFMRTNMDCLVLENFLIEKRTQDYIQVDESWMKEFPLD